MVKPHSPPKSLAERSTLMTDDQFESFWAGLYSRGRAAFADAPANEATPIDDTREAAAHRGRSNKPNNQRCGTCRGCAANDCGACKNCRDKPRFGGPGIKKKACLRRVCHKTRNRDDDDDDDDEDDETTEGMAMSPLHPSAPNSITGSTSHPQSEVTSPNLRPCSPSDAPPDMDEEAPPAEEVLDEGRPPLPTGSQLDMLSRMASSIGDA